MSGFFPFGSGGANVVVNPQDVTHEPLGYGADGSMTVLTSGTSNVKGAYANLGVTAAAWCGFWIEVGISSTSSIRSLMDISIDGGSTIAVADLYTSISTTGTHRIYIPLQVPAGRTVSARIQANTGSITIRAAVLGRVTGSNTPPGFGTCTRLVTADTAATRPPATNVALQSSLATWTQLLAATAADYGALLLSFGEATTNATAQQIAALIAIGASGSEVEWTRAAGFNGTTAGNLSRINNLVTKLIPSGSRIAAAALGATPGTDAIRVGLHGFS